MGYSGKLLSFDLNAQTVKTETIPTEIIRRFMGGQGPAAYF